MPVIVFASSKGGAGKTTACVLTGCELADQGKDKGISIGIVDADPNQHSAGWAELPDMPENLKIYSDINEDSILDTIEAANKSCQFVLVDLEGVSSNVVMFAVSQADLVIIPCQASQNDAKEAVKTIKMIKNSSRMVKHEINYSILFTRVSAAITTKTGKYLEKQFKDLGIDVFNTSLIDREAYKNIFSFGGSVNNLEGNDKRSIASRNKATENVTQLISEIKNRLMMKFKGEEN